MAQRTESVSDRVAGKTTTVVTSKCRAAHYATKHVSCRLESGERGKCAMRRCTNARMHKNGVTSPTTRCECSFPLAHSLCVAREICRGFHAEAVVDSCNCIFCRTLNLGRRICLTVLSLGAMELAAYLSIVLERRPARCFDSADALFSDCSLVCLTHQAERANSQADAGQVQLVTASKT